MKNFLKITVMALCLSFVPALARMDVFISPRGGFHPFNRHLVFDNGEGKEIPATVTNAAHDLIERTGEGGTICIAMYAFDFFDPLEKLIEAARYRNVKVKLLLDAAAEWTAPARKELFERLQKEVAEIKKNGGYFDFQVRLSTRELFKKHGKTRVLDDGYVIYGTMHEKFGVFTQAGEDTPFGVFAGSANFSWSASNRYAENRLYFLHEDAVAKQYRKEFGIIWNFYGEDAFGKCEDEIIRPAGPQARGVEAYFNVQGHRLDQRLINLIESVSPYGTLDIAIFSFTKSDIAQAIIRQAEMKPNAKFRLLFDQSQLEELPYLMGPWIASEARKKGLKNVEVRYKWRSNAYAIENEEVQISHPKNFLLHHKMVIVDGRRLATGSFNWSDSAQFRNLENLMIFDGELNGGAAQLISKFMREYDYLWSRLRTEAVDYKGVFRRPQVVTAAFGNELQETIESALKDEKLSEIFLFLEPYSWKGATLEDIYKGTGIDRLEIMDRLRKLRDKSLIRAKFYKGEVYYCEMD